jgi:hypothetical protein
MKEIRLEPSRHCRAVNSDDALIGKAEASQLLVHRGKSERVFIQINEVRPYATHEHTD